MIKYPTKKKLKSQKKLVCFTLYFEMITHNLIIILAGRHYNDVIMSTMASQITSLTIVYSTVYSRCRLKKTSKLRVTGLCEGNRWPVNSPHKVPVTRKMCPLDDVIMRNGLYCRFCALCPMRDTYSYTLIYFVAAILTVPIGTSNSFHPYLKSWGLHHYGIVMLWLYQCKRHNPVEFGQNWPVATTRKHSKARTVCIFLGMQCIYRWLSVMLQ